MLPDDETRQVSGDDADTRLVRPAEDPDDATRVVRQAEQNDQPDDATRVVRQAAQHDDLDDATRIVDHADHADHADPADHADHADQPDDATRLVARENDDTRVVGQDTTDETRIVSERVPRAGRSTTHSDVLSDAHRLPETPLGSTARYGVRTPTGHATPIQRLDRSADTPVVVLPGSAEEIRRAAVTRARSRSLLVVGVVVGATVIVAAAAVVAITVVAGI